MSAVCPKGHTSEADDYCDTCGTPIGATPTAPPAPIGIDTADPAPLAGDPGPGAAAPGGRDCPTCGATNPDGNSFCEECGASLDAPPAAAPTGEPARPTGVTAAPATPSRPVWEAVATADRAYFEQMDAGDIEFPAVYVARHFHLTGDRVTIGRRSVRQGITPDIDLSAAPEDIGVSHQHAVLVSSEDGWSVIDPGSANGTFLNQSEEPLVPNRPVPLDDGDQIHVGAWTTITFHRPQAD